MADRPSVLVVEDEPSENQFLTMTVRGLGHPAVSCFDGQAAIDWLQQNKPSLVFLDALLPKADGFAVLQEIRKLHPDVPVYMMSGVYKKKSYEQEAVGKLGATAYLHKPLPVLQVWEILERSLPAVPGSEVSRDFPGVPFWRRPLPAVVADLHLGGKTGLLFVRGNGGSGILFFEDGRIVFGRCNDPQLRLDRVLVQLGKLRREQLPRVAEVASQARGRLGDALVAEKLISPADLTEALALQQRNHVTRPLTWSEGSCWFLPSDAPRHETFKLQLDVPGMIFWACRHLEVDENLIRFLPHPDRKVRSTRNGDELQRLLGLSSEEAQIVELADGSRTMGQLRAIGRMLQVDVERVFAGLVSLQLVDLGPEPAPKAPIATLFGSSVPVAGDLARFPSALLLVSMAFSRKTGVLQLESATAGGPVQRTVHFTDGDIAFATSSDPSDRIGQVLLRSGKIGKDQLQQALATAATQPGAALGRVLVGGGLLQPDDLHAALVLQAQQVVTGLIGWISGTFRFQENDGPTRDIVPLGLDTRQALMTALRTCPFTDIASRLPPPDTRLRATATAHQLAADLPLTALEQRLRLHADGSLTVQEIASSCPEGPEAALRAVFALTTIGLVEGFRLPAGATPPPPRQPAVQAQAPPAHVPQIPLDAQGSDPALTGESSGARARKTHVLAVDERFDVDEQEETAAEVPGDAPCGVGETTAASIREDWSTTGECSFADLGDAPAAGIREDWSSTQESSFAGLGGTPAAAAIREDWSAPEESSFAGLADAVAASGPAPSFDLGSLAAELEADLPLHDASGWPEDPRPGGANGATSAAVATPLLTAAQVDATCEFLVRLADWLRTCPEAVPESVKAVLPREVRAMFGL